MNKKSGLLLFSHSLGFCHLACSSYRTVPICIRIAAASHDTMPLRPGGPKHSRRTLWSLRAPVEVPPGSQGLTSKFSDRWRTCQAVIDLLMNAFLPTQIDACVGTMVHDMITQISLTQTIDVFVSSGSKNPLVYRMQLVCLQMEASCLQLEASCLQLRLGALLHLGIVSNGHCNGL